MVDNETIKATAESVTEVAKTAQKTLETTNKLGGFIAKFISSPLEQVSGIVTDKLRFYRWENQLKLMENAEKLLKERGNPDRLISLKLAVPLLENASMEDEASLQKLWANLLVNFSIQSSRVDHSLSFIDLLKSIGPLEAKILKEVYSIPFDPHRGIVTRNLPETVYRLTKEEKPQETDFILTEEIEFALNNLDRLGCINLAGTWGGGRTPNQINQTLYGKKFFEACS